MSATRDKSQKIAFVYSSLYEVYKKGKAAALDADAPLAVRHPSAHVIKAEEASAAPVVAETPVPAPGAKITAYNPIELIGKRVARPEAIGPARRVTVTNPAISSLKDNLKALNDLQSRLRFMLQELEELVKE
jgi:hypothetical protein